MLNNLAGDPAHQEDLLRLRAALEDLLLRHGDLGDTDERELIARHVVRDQLAEYKERCPKDELPADQIIGPRPIPTTLNEALACR